MFGKNLSIEEQNIILNAFSSITGASPEDYGTIAPEIVTAIEQPLRKVLLSGDIQGDIFESVVHKPGAPTLYSVDLLTPGDEGEYYAFVMPDEGRIPERRVEASSLMIPTYRIANGIDINHRILRNASWPVINRMLEILEAGFIKKMNDDGWATLLTAAVDRNILVSDASASPGQFTPKLITLMQVVMRRNGGGNSATKGRSKLTDLYVSVEAQADLFSWNLDLIPDVERAKIYNSSIDSPDMNVIHGVRVHTFDELGENQDYQSFFTTTAGGTMAASDVEIVVGLDRQRQDSFIRPVAKELQIFEDNTTHRRGIFSMYGDAEIGFAVLDSRRVLVGSL